MRRHPELLQLAAALRREHPARSAAQIADILAFRHGVRISPRVNVNQKGDHPGLWMVPCSSSS